MSAGTVSTVELMLQINHVNGGLCEIVTQIKHVNRDSEYQGDDAEDKACQFRLGEVG